MSIQLTAIHRSLLTSVAIARIRLARPAAPRAITCFVGRVRVPVERRLAAYDERSTSLEMRRRREFASYDTIRYEMLVSRALESRHESGSVSLIYRTETTTKKCKTEKLKSKNGYFQSKSLGNHVVSPEEEKERLRWEGF